MSDEHRPENYERREDVIDGWPIAITTYVLAGRYYCKIDNVDPGALIGRADGATAEEALLEARVRARARLSTTSRMKESIRELRAQVAVLDERLKQSGSRRDPNR